MPSNVCVCVCLGFAIGKCVVVVTDLNRLKQKLTTERTNKQTNQAKYDKRTAHLLEMCWKWNHLYDNQIKWKVIFNNTENIINDLVCILVCTWRVRYINVIINTKNIIYTTYVGIFFFTKKKKTSQRYIDQIHS